MSAINAKINKSNKFKKEILLSTTFGILLFLSIFYFFDTTSDSKQAGFSKSKHKRQFFSEENQNMIGKIDSLLLINNNESVELAFDLASEMEYNDTSSVDYKLITAKTIFRLGKLNNNRGLLERAYSIANKIKDLDYKDFTNQAYCFFILSNVEYFLGDKNLAFEYIKKSYFISNSLSEIKMFWKKLNREQLQKWRSSK